MIHNSSGVSLDLVNIFCYMGEMLHVDWDADAEQNRWNKFRQLLTGFTNNDVYFLMK